MKKQSGIYKYLNSSGVLEHGDELAIAAAKKKYWKQYKAAWRSQQRKQQTQFTVSFTVHEAKQIDSAAKKHKRSSTRYVHDSVFAYTRQSFIFPDPVGLGAIRQYLVRCYSSLQTLSNDNLLPFEVARKVQTEITELEKAILDELTQPKLLEQCIADILRNNPAYRELLLQTIQNIRV